MGIGVGVDWIGGLGNDTGEASRQVRDDFLEGKENEELTEGGGAGPSLTEGHYWQEMRRKPWQGKCRLEDSFGFCFNFMSNGVSSQVRFFFSSYE